MICAQKSSAINAAKSYSRNVPANSCILDGRFILRGMLSDTLSSVAHTNDVPVPLHSAARAILQILVVVFILLVYCYPSLKTRSEVGASPLPSIFAPDLTLYLNLAAVKSVGGGQVLNPYYMVPVPANGTAYLKIRLAPALFSTWTRLLGGRTWLSMFIWNLFWWGLLCVITLRLFGRFLPANSWWIEIAGLGLLMLVNIGMLKPALAAWLHLPSLSGFEGLALPFMRAFTPQVPIPLLLAYLTLQMEALRDRSRYPWVGMGVLQLLALFTFPYATLEMAGLTCVSVLWQLLSPGPRGAWRIPLAYGAACAIADIVFLKHGSINIYASHSSLIHFQPQLLPQLVGGAWLILCVLTVITVLAKTLPAEVKWPLVGLGATTLLMMLGDSVVPSTVLLLTVHANYFMHTASAIISTFLLAAALTRIDRQSVNSTKVRTALAVVLAILALTGLLLSLGTYRASLPANRDQVEISHLLKSFKLVDGDLFIARSVSVDDACGWVTLLSKENVLFCTDAETMLTPEQNHDVQRFRQALYLYLSGQNSVDLQRELKGPNRSALMYRLGFWAEAISLSRDEQNEGITTIQTDLVSRLQEVEGHGAWVTQFFRQFKRIIVIDDLQHPAFVPARVGSFLKPEAGQHLDNWVLLSYVPE